MATEVSAADGALQRGAQVVADAKASLNTELNQLEGKLASIGAQWQGQGASAFTMLMERWRTDARKITSALDTFEQNLTSSQTTYTSTDDTQSSAMNSLSSRLG
ncbi:WXG100 family type VII secretion target [Pseudactinotalea sp. HY158]|uniref:WXG100 family type VII secretion target n=2 Tax=unclassified Pseudactinotalea TaxID=2649176 RepID=UPI00129CB5BE|nr:WXG100 family type VII secretion target [Pseudactinotalea sp. HY158]QGH70459.1 WXG100 family type VII secretion target [Pseudactinotalea sp. HY158]QGH70560.1 WXG100 family type VII secretion target [Pseudactinotalea sp. HY158]